MPCRLFGETSIPGGKAEEALEKTRKNQSLALDYAMCHPDNAGLGISNIADGIDEALALARSMGIGEIPDHSAGPHCERL